MTDELTPIEAVETETAPNADYNVVFGGAVKALGDGRIRGYLHLFGNTEVKDLQGEYFSKNTDFLFEDFPIEGLPIKYHHCLDRTIKTRTLGRIEQYGVDDAGVWYETTLQMRDAYDRKIYQLVEMGKLGSSAGALPQTVRVSKSGEILQWGDVEGSLTPTPADYRNKVLTVKSLQSLLADDAIEALAETQREADASEASPATPEADPVERDDSAAPAIKAQPETEDETPSTENTDMTPEEIQALIDAKVEERVAAVKAELAPAPEETPAEAPKAEDAPDVQAIVDAAVKAASEKFLSQPQSKVGGFRSPEANKGARIEVRSPYADLSAEDMSFLHMLRRAASKASTDYEYAPDPKFVREALDKAQKSYVKGDLKLDPEDATTKRLLAVKSDELNHSTLATGGDEWVPNVWSNDLWLRARLENVVLPRLGMVEMPSNPYELPVQSTDPTVYLVPETTAENQLALDVATSPIPDSKVATTKVTLTAKKLGLRVGISAEVEEDSIIPFIAETRAQALRSMLDSMDNVIINGDDSTTGNINSDGETISDATRKYLAFNGLIHAPLVTTTSMSVDAAGATPSLSLLRQARGKLLNAYGTDIRNLMWVTDYATYIKLLDLDEVSSAAARGSAPTGVTGVLGAIDGIDLFVSNEMALADSDGKVTQTANVVNRGRALLVHRNVWRTGFRRRVVSSLNFFPELDSYQMTVTVRLALINRDTQGTSVVYNLGV